MNKRKAISDKLGIDVDAMITNKHLAVQETEEKEEKPARRRTAAKKTTTSTRRVKKTDAE